MSRAVVNDVPVVYTTCFQHGWKYAACAATQIIPVDPSVTNRSWRIHMGVPKFVGIMSGIALTIICWGLYGPVLHRGQMMMEGSRMRPFICVGLAYLALAVIVPSIILGANGDLVQGWKFKGVSWSLVAGAAGAVGALGIIIAMASGGKPIYVMPLVFGCAPVVNVIMSMYLSHADQKPSPMFYSGIILVSLGAAMVLIFAPKSPTPHGSPTPRTTTSASTPGESTRSVTP